MFIRIGENIYAKDMIALIELGAACGDWIRIYLKNSTSRSEYTSMNFKSHAEALKEMERIYAELQKEG